MVIVLMQYLENGQDHSPNVPEALCIGTSLVAMMALLRKPKPFQLCKDWRPKDPLCIKLGVAQKHRYNVT